MIQTLHGGGDYIIVFTSTPTFLKELFKLFVLLRHILNALDSLKVNF